MHIARVRINNYKCYRSTSVLHLKTGFNIITGQNNTGKTALLEILALRATPTSPHRSRETVPQAHTDTNEPASAEFWIESSENITKAQPSEKQSITNSLLHRLSSQKYLICKPIHLPSSTYAVNSIAGPFSIEDHEHYPGNLPADSNQRFESIHGARLLEKLFKELSENRVTYHKVTHSFALTRWLVENSPEDLREISDLLKGFLEPQTMPIP